MELIILGNKGAPEAHIVYSVFWSFHLFPPMKQQTSTFNSYNSFPGVIFIRNMVNVSLITHIMCLHNSVGLLSIPHNMQGVANLFHCQRVQNKSKKYAKIRN